jgi:hypothetical protein
VGHGQAASLIDGERVGAAFVLNRPTTGAKVPLPSGWGVELVAGSRRIVARGPSGGGYRDVRDEGVAAAQQALDVLAIRGGSAETIVDVDSEHLTWWTEPGGTVLRVVFVSDMNVTVSASGGGQPPTVKWHASFRYFRLSQTTTDLFDAYRNLYLALESILSTVVPPGLGKKGRTESSGL